MGLDDLRARAAGRMNLVGGRLFLDFINTHGSRSNAIDTIFPSGNEKLNDYLDIVAWGWHAGILSEVQAKAVWRENSRSPREAMSVYRRAIRMREAIYRVCRALLNGKQSAKADLEIINAELARCHEVQTLSDDPSGFRLTLQAPEAALDRVLWHVTQSAVEWLTTGDVSRLRECDGEDCGWLFADTSKNVSRRWCHMGDCGNRAKVRNFRLRKGQER